jgi:molybdopterin converting factor small subunit
MNKISIEILCFAGLRKYFGSATAVSLESGAFYSDVIDELIKIKPDAEEVLKSSRLAVNEEFIPLHEKIKSVRTIMLIPPSSGG